MLDAEGEKWLCLLNRQRAEAAISSPAGGD